jgi:hypothetical protein
MKTASKKSSLSVALKGPKTAPKVDPIMEAPEKEKQYMIAGHFSLDVKRALGMAKVYSDKNLQQLMGEAFNMVCAKYGAPEAYSE